MKKRRNDNEVVVFSGVPPVLFMGIDSFLHSTIRGLSLSSFVSNEEEKRISDLYARTARATSSTTRPLVSIVGNEEELLRQVFHPPSQDFPWLQGFTTKSIGIGCKTTQDLPRHSIVCNYGLVFVSVYHFLSSKSLVLSHSRLNSNCAKKQFVLFAEGTSSLSAHMKLTCASWQTGPLQPERRI